MAIKGFLFDFDGLILNTEIPLFTAYQELFHKHGFAYTYRNWWKTIGTGPSAYDPAVDLATRIQEPQKADSIREYAISHAKEVISHLPALPGVAEFIHSACELDIPMAVVSSSAGSWVDPYLEQLSLTQYFTHIVTSDIVDSVKPAPDLYLFALEKMGITADEGIAFEDSPNGIKAAQAAGIYCIAVPNEITREMPVEIADQIVTSFFEISPSELIHETLLSK